MMQKILISRNVKADTLTIEEFALVEWQPNQKDFLSLTNSDFSLLHKEAYQSKKIKTAISKGKNALISSLRTKTFYPINPYMETIADSVIALYRSKKEQKIELLFDDKELLPGYQEQ